MPKQRPVNAARRKKLTKLIRTFEYTIRRQTENPDDPRTSVEYGRASALLEQELKEWQPKGKPEADNG